jgi:uncharacterized protein (DUF433 family)
MSPYPVRKELLVEYPELKPEDLDQVPAYAAASMDDRIIDALNGECNL